MAYSALVVQMLISSPSDLPREHHEVITRAIRVWNGMHGRVYGIHFSPTDWNEGASPEFGPYPQAVLNEQIVDDSDVALVIFTDRLGSPTRDHPSGTAEEIDRMIKTGKDAAILLNNCPRPPSRGASDQQKRLDDYIAEVRKTAFTKDYDSTESLRQVIDNLLGRLASKYRREADAGLKKEVAAEFSGSGQLSADITAIENGIWPRVEVDDRKKWHLVLESTLPHAARNVRFRYEDENGNPSEFDIMAERHDAIGVLPPKGTAQFPIFAAFGTPPAAMCIVTWEDTEGTQHETRATVRTR
ncbi:hypothetical protein [Rhodococcus koreensis]